MPAQIVDKFNVDGQDYEIEPPMDAVPTEGSLRAVQSGGVYSELIATRGDTPVASGPNAQGAFTRKGAYDFFQGAETASEWRKVLNKKYIGSVWKRCEGLPSGFIAEAVAKNDSLYVCGGINASGYAALGLYWSEDGKSWTKCTAAVDIAPTAIAYNNGIWVAATSKQGVFGPSSTPGSGMWWSNDGKVWTQGTGITNEAVTSMVYANGIWVISTYGNGMWWSEDGKAWTQGTGITGSSTVLSFRDVKYANGLFVAVSRYMYWSEDGKAWTQATGGYDEMGSTLLQYVHNRWFAQNGSWSSTDGKVWVAGTGLSRAAGIRTPVQYVYGTYVTIGKSNDYTSFAYYSSNGTSWTAASFPDFTGTFSNNPSGMYASNGLLMMIVGSSADVSEVILYSVDRGHTWYKTDVPSVAADTRINIFCRNGTWIISASSSNFWWSLDGKNLAPCGIIGSLGGEAFPSNSWFFYAFDDIYLVTRGSVPLYADYDLLEEAGVAI